jgi:hypothetical protein
LEPAELLPCFIHTSAASAKALRSQERCTHRQAGHSPASTKQPFPSFAGLSGESIFTQHPVILRKGFSPQSQNPVVERSLTLLLDSAMPLCNPQNDRMFLSWIRRLNRRMTGRQKV